MPDHPSTDLSTPDKFGDVAHEPDRLSVDGWQKMRFGELAFHISDRVDDPKTAGVTTYVGLDHLDPGSLKIKRRGTPDDVNATKLRVKPGQIIFGKRRAYQRKVAVADFDGICSAHAMVLEANPKATAPGFLPFFMQSDIFFDRALAISEGSLSPTIKWRTLAAQEFLIPPIARQKELVELFQAIEDAISATEESILAAEELKRSLMSELLTKGVGHTKFQKPDIGRIPTPWQLMRLGDILEDVQYGLNDQAKNSGTYPILRMNNISNGRIMVDDLKYVELDDESLKNHQLVKGDLLFNRTNSIDWVGKVGIFELEEGIYVFASYLLRLKVKKSLVYARFVNYYLNLSDVQGKLKNLATRGISQANINPTSLKSINMPIPPLEEQIRIIRVLAGIDSQIDLLSKHKDRIEALKSKVVNGSLSNAYELIHSEATQNLACV